ncbi:MAG: hypothetical protein N2110_07765 [Flavobacteriales bacterium]|nr:hypothetical protein [Flavobacteriales bacterium]MCX7768902.1 hypothetical protein [Flavobacteriales bacterium]MDW8410028.1 hypothetical protein [Flavobacteriales bacterium]
MTLLSLSTSCDTYHLPLAWSTPPPAPLLHPHEEQWKGYIGARVGQALQEKTTNKFKDNILLNLNGGGVFQHKSFLFEANGWAGFAHYRFYDFDTLHVPNRNIITYAVQAHLNAGWAPRLGKNKKSKLELGGSLGIGVENSDDTFPFPMTFSPFIGAGFSLSPVTTLGFRWNFVGLGTGFTASVKYKNAQFFAATMPYALIGMNSKPWTMGVLVFLDSKQRRQGE